MNKGFTLVELIGVVVILSAILLIIIPNVTSGTKKGIKNADEQTKQNIILAAQNWASDNKSLMPQTNGNIYKVKVSVLTEEGYITDKVVKPSNGADLSNSCVKITNTSQASSIKKTYSYEFQETGC